MLSSATRMSSTCCDCSEASSRSVPGSKVCVTCGLLPGVAEEFGLQRGTIAPVPARMMSAATIMSTGCFVENEITGR
ncbi:hypothetical protein IOD13_02135 [Brevibacterium casei]|nr:hypothetical protein [Brevibacterium casei]